MLTIIIFALVLGLLVFVHELGHFLEARRNGIKAEEFGFGFPPRLIGAVWNDERKKYDIITGNREVASPHTVYSLNWIPLGGFVRIKGENADHGHEPDSFAVRPAGTRIRVLAAGVIMNFLFAWFLYTIIFSIGMPQQIEPEDRGKFPGERVRITQVLKNTPAEHMGLELNDAVISVGGTSVQTAQDIIAAIRDRKGVETSVVVERGKETLSLTGTPRVDYPEGEGALGVALVETAVVSYPWYQAVSEGALTTVRMAWAILEALGKMIGMLVGIGERTTLDLTGPVGIVYLTKQMSDMGFVYLLWFAALLSVNLGIFNILPIPALDGGRILFVLIEKVKGSPVGHEVENRIHQIGFLLLLLLMLFVTIRDFSQFKILTKLRDLIL